MRKERPIIYTPSGRAGEYANRGQACNLYRGCLHGCRYCYVPQVLHMSREDFNAKSVPVHNALKRLEADCSKIYDEPIFLSFTCDAFQPFGTGWSVTSEAIGIIKASGNNVNMLTKGHIPDEDLYMLDAGDSIGVTLTFDNVADSLLWEPKAQIPQARIATLAAAHERGIRTWVSFEPVIDPEQVFSLLDQVKDIADVVKIGKANHLNRWNWPSEEWRQRVEAIDWAKFAWDVSKRCCSRNLEYVLKQDLLELIGGAQR